MAAKLYNNNRPINEVLARIANSTLDTMRYNFAMQHVWPYELYPGFAEVNKKRKAKGLWYATGEGLKSFSTRFNATPGNESIYFSYNDYLRYVDIGVGQGTTADEVSTARKARKNRRYTSRWDRAEGRSHRPSIMMEMRHVATLLGEFFQDYYGMDGVAKVYPVFEKMENNPIVLTV
ncbi:MAG: hypothetical protein HUK06_01635 [Bacteroidaceae bacterium]|nr:hypothetical protein [Bacteroidaceae bacterium]